MKTDYSAEIAAEEKAVSDIKRMAIENIDALTMLWNRGNGCGGGILDMIACEIGKRSPSDPVARNSRINPKQPIRAEIRTRVFERDAYRCVFCNSHIDLTVDHIKPECKGGTLDFENLQTLCRPCNSSKGSKE